MFSRNIMRYRFIFSDSYSICRQDVWDLVGGHHTFWKRGDRMTSGKLMSAFLLIDSKIEGFTASKLGFTYYGLSDGQLKPGMFKTLMDEKATRTSKLVRSAV